MSEEDFFLKKPPVSAGKLYDLLESCSRYYKIFNILHTAEKVKLFDQLNSLKSPEDLSAKLGTDPMITKVMCDILVNLGLLEKNGEYYRNTKMSHTFLKDDSPYCQREVLKNLQMNFRLWDKLPTIIKNGPISLREQDFFEDNLIHALAGELMTGELQETVKIITELPEFQKSRKLLDLGGGHGLYSIAFTRLNSALNAYVFDFPEVIRDTKNYIKSFAADNVDVIPGNLFTDDIGNGYDIILFSYNPGGKNPDLVPKIYGALNKGGLFITKHTFYKKDEKSKNLLLDAEWNLTSFEGVMKENKIYSFAGDLCFEDYLKLLEEYFSTKKIIDAPQFGCTHLSKFGDTLDSKIIIAKKGFS